MAEQISPQQERVGFSEEIIPQPEIIQSERMATTISRAELGQLVSLSDQISNLDLPEEEKAEKLKKLDELSLDLTGLQASTYNYYFPDQLPYFNFEEKLNYRKVAVLNAPDNKAIHDFWPLPDGNIAVLVSNSSGKERLHIAERSKDGKFKFKSIKNGAKYCGSVQALPDGRILAHDEEGTVIIIEKNLSGQYESFGSVRMKSGIEFGFSSFQSLPGGKIIGINRESFIELSENHDGSWSKNIKKKIEGREDIHRFKVTPEGMILASGRHNINISQKNNDGERQVEIIHLIKESDIIKEIWHLHPLPDGGFLVTTKSPIDYEGEIGDTFVLRKNQDGEWQAKGYSLGLRFLVCLPNGKFIVADDHNGHILYIENFQDVDRWHILFGYNVSLFGFHCTSDGKMMVLEQTGISRTGISIYDGD